MSAQPQPNPADLVHRNELGYYEVTRKPTPDELLLAQPLFRKLPGQRPEPDRFPPEP